MKYTVPSVNEDSDLDEDLKNIEKVIDDLNQRRDSGLSKDLLDKLKNQLLISQVYHSNAIEGNKLSLRETELILNGMVVNERPLKDELEAKSLANATEYLYKLIDGREPLTKRTILELHGLIMQNIPAIKAGSFRQDDVTIKGSEHTPPSFLDVEIYIDELFQWMNRNSHKHHPLVMCAILHHWLTWIHPFSDGNGRVSRLFLNFFLLQKGYPEIVIKISERDKYYNALISADKGNISDLVELFTDNIRSTINIYEELVNEEERQRSWKTQYKNLSLPQYEKAKETHSYSYEVWKNQIAVFKAIISENIKEIQEYLPHLDIKLKSFDVLTFSQYLDLLEDRKVSNTWYLSLRIFDMNKKDGMNFIFYFNRFHRSHKLSLLGTDVKDRTTGKQKYRKSPPQIKLYVSTRKDRISEDLNRNIDLVNIGTWKDQLSFGVIDREWLRGKENVKNPKLSTVTENPGKVIRTFIDQILINYYDLKINSKLI